MQKGRECCPGQVVEILEDGLYKVELIDGSKVEVPKSAILKMKDIQVEVGQWVAVGYKQVLYRWKDLKATDQADSINWEQRIGEIPQFAFEARGSHDAHAARYEEMLEYEIDDYIRENYFVIQQRVIDWANLTAGMVLLEIGIGTGLLTEKIPEGVVIFGIDISEKMMEKAREKNLPIKLIVGSFLDIPFPDQFFQRIVSTFAFHHLTPEEKILAFQEMDRVLQPGGSWLIGDFMFENDQQKDELVEKFTAEGRTDMLEEFEEEYFTEIDTSIEILEEMGYQVEYERGSTLSWILKVTKKF